MKPYFLFALPTATMPWRPDLPEELRSAMTGIACAAREAVGAERGRRGGGDGRDVLRPRSPKCAGRRAT